MPSSLLSKFVEWVEKKPQDNTYSITALLESIGYSDILWMMLTQEEIHIIEFSSSIKPRFVESLKKQSNYDKIKNWIKDTLQDNIIQLGNSSRTILYVHKDQFGNIGVIVADHNPSIKQSDVRLLTRMAVEFINNSQKIKTLENTIRLTTKATPSDTATGISDITLNSLKPAFIEAVIPHVFYSYVHEAYGPYIFDAVPEDMLNPNYIITAVKLYSGLDSEMVAEVGQVFKTDPVKKPVLGEVFSIVFSLPSPQARGKFEVHSISALIPHEFLNISHSLIGEFKTQLFMVAERIRILHEQNNWGLAVEKMGTNNHLKEIVNPILRQLQQDLALIFAINMEPDDVLSW